MKVILISGKAQHGKDTCALYLQDILSKHGKKVLVAHYGDLLKYICKQFFGWNGNKDETGRTLLQHVGTDVIRRSDADYWVNFVKGILELFPDIWDFVLIPDCRFPNEVDMIEGTHLRVVREGFESPLTKEQQTHESEVALDDHPYDQLIVNDGSLFELYRKCEALAMSMGWIPKNKYCSVSFKDESFCEDHCFGKKCPLKDLG